MPLGHPQATAPLIPASIYMKRIGPLDKAGAYAAQENEMDVIASIEGSRTNVVGLPMETLGQALKSFTCPNQ